MNTLCLDSSAARNVAQVVMPKFPAGRNGPRPNGLPERRQHVRWQGKRYWSPFDGWGETKAEKEAGRAFLMSAMDPRGSWATRGVLPKPGTYLHAPERPGWWRNTPRGLVFCGYVAPGAVRLMEQIARIEHERRDP